MIASRLEETIQNGSLRTQPDTSLAPRVQEETALASNFAESNNSKESNSPEKQRRSHANKGKTPWNKGRKHSEETKELIRAKTREAMGDPKIRERLRERTTGLTLSLEIKLKIRQSILNFWDLKKNFEKRQESCVREWEEMIADAARSGNSPEDITYQWDSYDMILADLQSAWKESRRRKARAERKSLDHRLKISLAIRAKWADPNYRKSVQDGVQGYLSNRHQSRRVPKKKAATQLNHGQAALEDEVGAAGAGGSISLLETSGMQNSSLMVEKPPQAYKDPLAQNKLEKLKQMRARRLSVDEKKRKELAERARALMAEAKRAASALEAAAIKDKNAIAPLLETRRLLAEAARSFESAGLEIDGLNSVLLEAAVVEGSTMNDDSFLARRFTPILVNGTAIDSDFTSRASYGDSMPG